MPAIKILEENEWFTFWEEEGIFCCQYKNPVVDLDIAKMSVASRLKLTKNQPSKLFVDLTHVKSATKEARAYYASEEALHLSDAAAAIGPSIITKIILNFYLNFNKPRKPFKIFSSKEKAFEWLKSVEK